MQSLKQARKAAQFHQKNFQDLTGIPQREVSLIECGRKIPHKRILKRIESVLGRISWLATSGMPKADRRQKKYDALDLQLKFIRAFQALHQLSKSERYQLLIDLHEWIMAYLDHEAELEKIAAVQKNLFQQKFIETPHKN